MKELDFASPSGSIEINKPKDNQVILTIYDDIRLGQELTYQLILHIEMTQPTDDFCLVDFECFDSVPVTRSTTNGTLDPEAEDFTFNSQVVYECGIGREFIDDTLVLHPNQSFTCGWDGNWTDSNELMNCSCKSKLDIVSLLLQFLN